MATPLQIANDLAQWRLKLKGRHDQGMPLDPLCSSLHRAEKTIREHVEDLESRDCIISKMEDEQLALQQSISKLHRDLDEYRDENERLRRK